MNIVLKIFVFIAFIAISDTADAGVSCTLPDVHAVSVASCPRSEAVKTGQRPPEGYLLALSWSPGFCQRRGEKADPWQCKKNQFAWVLHGLWPQYHDGTWPSWCASTAVLPASLVREQLCSIPGSTLVQCQWAKHGTCTPFTPEQYFKKSRELFNDVNLPHEFAGGVVDRATFVQAVAAANPGRSADSIALRCRQRRFLDEIRLCYDAELRPSACRNLKQTCTLPKIILPSTSRSVEPDYAKTH